MANNKKKAVVDSGNKLCREIGHCWESTTADNFRKCMRSDCRVVQRKISSDEWVNVVQKTGVPDNSVKKSNLINLSLFS
jgi:hypothetical protein